MSVGVSHVAHDVQCIVTDGQRARERAHKDARLDVIEDEHEPRRAILVRPRLQLDRGMEHPLHPMNDDGPVSALNVEDALDAQQIVAIGGDRCF